MGLKNVDRIQYAPIIKIRISRLESNDLNVGDSLDVMSPDGRFTTPIDGSHDNHYLLIAAGSGITPCLSIAKSVLQDEPQSRITLLFGNRTVSSMMFRKDIAALKDTHTERFNVIHMFSGERAEFDLFNGRITAAKVKQLSQANLLSVAQYHSAFLCGPMAMVEETSVALLNLGMDEKRIHQELFTTNAPTPNTTGKPVTNSATTVKGRPVTVTLDGTESTFAVNPSEDTILAAAQRAGIDMPFSCAGGMCCTCRCKIVKGTADMDANFSLAQWEIDAGYTLACQARPTSDVLVLDFDAT